jgi:hypothetical protein
VILNNGEARILPFPMHCKHAAHMQFVTKRALSGGEQRTATEEVEIVPPTAARRGDADIELAVKMPGYQKERGNGWSPFVGHRRNNDAASLKSDNRVGEPYAATDC